MKLKETFMSSPICVKILKYQCIPKNFLLLCRQFFQFITLKQTIVFSQLQLANNFFNEKGNKKMMVRLLVQMGPRFNSYNYNCHLNLFDMEGIDLLSTIFMLPCKP